MNNFNLKSIIEYTKSKFPHISTNFVVPKKKKGRVVKPGMEEQVIDALRQKLKKKLDESMNTS